MHTLYTACIKCLWTWVQVLQSHSYAELFHLYLNLLFFFFLFFWLARMTERRRSKDKQKKGQTQISPQAVIESWCQGHCAQVVTKASLTPTGRLRWTLYVLCLAGQSARPGAADTWWGAIPAWPHHQGLPDHSVLTHWLATGVTGLHWASGHRWLASEAINKLLHVFSPLKRRCMRPQIAWRSAVVIYWCCTDGHGRAARPSLCTWGPHIDICLCGLIIHSQLLLHRAHVLYSRYSWCIYDLLCSPLVSLLNHALQKANLTNCLST